MAPSGERSTLADEGILKAAMAPVARLLRRSADATPAAASGDRIEQARRLFRDGLVKYRAGDRDGALSAFDSVLVLCPDLADVVMARAELLDGIGRLDEARVGYARARELWAGLPYGGADRRYVFRRRGPFAFEVAAYEMVQNRVRNKILPQLAHGNALLAAGRAAEALDSYERALKVGPKQHEALALKGEALSALGRYGEAIEIFDRILAANPRDAETLNARGIARLATGRLAEANEDWQAQLNLLSAASSAARGCLAMRLGNHGIAYAEFELARKKEPDNGYWSLYRASAGRLAGITDDTPPAASGGRWPDLLLAFLAGQLTEDALVEKAIDAEQLTEARFQMGVAVAAINPAVARRHWKEVVDRGLPAMIEFAAASNALARLGA